MKSIAVGLPCGRPFDNFGFCICRSILAIQADYDIHLYLGLKLSNYYHSVNKSELPSDKITWLFEPEDMCSSIPFFNKMYQQCEEDYLLNLVDDYKIVGDIFAIIKFIEDNKQQGIPPIATFAVVEDRRPNEIAYYPGVIGHGGSSGAHPTFRATNCYATELSWLKETFTTEIYQMERYYADDLFAFTLQHKYKFVVPIWGNAISVGNYEPAMAFSSGYDATRERQKYCDKVRLLEAMETKQDANIMKKTPNESSKSPDLSLRIDDLSINTAYITMI